ncbi:MAG: HD-GYP domain-containing protein [Acidobacteriota bacterium]
MPIALLLAGLPPTVVMVVMALALPHWSHRGLFFGVTVGAEFAPTAQRRAILRGYRGTVAVTGLLALAMASAAFWHLLWLSLAAPFVAAAGMLAGYLRTHHAALAHAAAPETLREASLRVRRERLPGGRDKLCPSSSWPPPASTWPTIGASCRRAEEQARESVRKLERLLDETVQALVAVVEAKDPYTSGHQRRVVRIAAAMAEEMSLAPERIRDLRVAGLLHDIGKIQVPAEILAKPGSLSAAEKSIIQTHSEVGYRLLKGISFEGPVAEIVLQPRAHGRLGLSLGPPGRRDPAGGPDPGRGRRGGGHLQPPPLPAGLRYPLRPLRDRVPLGLGLRPRRRQSLPLALPGQGLLDRLAGTP